MAKSSGANIGTWLISGAIVLVGVVIVITLVVLLGGRGQDNVAFVSPSASAAPSPKPERHGKTPRPARSTSGPTTSVAPSPTPSPSPATDPSVLVRSAVLRAARQDRRGEVTHVGSVDFYHSSDCPEKQAGQATVRYNTGQRIGIFITCLKDGRWLVAQGPIYGE